MKNCFTMKGLTSGDMTDIEDASSRRSVPTSIKESVTRLLLFGCHGIFAHFEDNRDGYRQVQDACNSQGYE